MLCNALLLTLKNKKKEKRIQSLLGEQIFTSVKNIYISVKLFQSFYILE